MLFKAYEAGHLSSLGGSFEKDGLSEADFGEAVESEIEGNYDAIWALLAKTRGRMVPVGFVFGFWAHPKIPPFMHVGDMIWMPWATRRNIVEASVHFFNRIRREIKLIEYARIKDKKFFQMLCDHGIMRHVGVSHVIYENEPAHIFETKAPEKWH